MERGTPCPSVGAVSIAESSLADRGIVVNEGAHGREDVYSRTSVSDVFLPERIIPPTRRPRGAQENVTREADQIRLENILSANQALMTFSILEDDLKALWDYRHPDHAERF